MSFLSSKNKQSTANQQVGVSGSGVGISGSTFGGAGGTIGNITFQTSDPETVKAALESTAAVAETAVTGANVMAINALGTLERQQDRNNALVSGALAATQELAAQVAPVSEGNQVLAIQSNQTKVLVAAAIAFVVIGGIIYYKKHG